MSMSQHATKNALAETYKADILALENAEAKDAAETKEAIAKAKEGAVAKTKPSFSDLKVSWKDAEGNVHRLAAKERMDEELFFKSVSGIPRAIREKIKADQGQSVEVQVSPRALAADFRRRSEGRHGKISILRERLRLLLKGNK